MEELSKFQDVVISCKMRNIYPHIFAKSVGQSNAFLPCNSVASVSAMRCQGSALPCGVDLSVGVGPVHEPKRAKGLQFFEEKRMEVYCLP